MTEKILFWFRRDLRLTDNTGLYEALKKGLPVIPLFIFDYQILNQLESKNDRRVDFIFSALQVINKQLEKFGSSICIKAGEPLQVIKQLVESENITAVYANRDYEPYARQRDTEIQQLLHSKAINFLLFKDQVVFEPQEILKADQSPYTIYTPYSKLWKKTLTADQLIHYSSETFTNYSREIPENTVNSLSDIGFSVTDLKFTMPEIRYGILQQYHATRDFPGLEGTSGLSTDLRFGTISIRRLVKIALETNETWLGELIWREFFMMILYFFPKVTVKSFKPAYDFIQWRNNEQEFERWCSGNTGYPIVDAGMRELLATGTMHNRVRMITASFLTKHLLIDWRWGEAWFASKLLDFDLAANNGNWQWAAGCGCDAAPYFRIFNPYEQTKKFDPRLEYVGRWIPKLETASYPAPIVEHKFARQRALENYKVGLENAKFK